VIYGLSNNASVDDDQDDLATAPNKPHLCSRCVIWLWFNIIIVVFNSSLP